jgi:hypothetical protein
MRQGPVQDHVHGIVQVRLLGEGLQRLLFGAFDGKVGGAGHGGPRLAAGIIEGRTRWLEIWG